MTNSPLSIFWDSVRPLKLITLLLYPLAALGIYLSHQNHSSDVQLLLDMCPWYWWALLVGYVWVARMVWLFCWDGVALTRRTTPIAGIIFWSFLLASNIQNPGALAFGTLYSVCLLIEGWILSRAWLEK